MLRRAWGRSMALLFRNSGALIVPNLQVSFGTGLMVMAHLGAVALKLPRTAFIALKVLAAMGVWMLISWLAFSARKAFENSRLKSGLTEMKAWTIIRGKERLVSGAACLLGAFWVMMALDFYQAAAAGTPWAMVVRVVHLLAVFIIAATVALNFGLSSRGEVSAAAEWKASVLMGLAFVPQCLGALVLLLIQSGAAGYLLADNSWWGRLLLAPALALPIFGASLGAAFLVALSDEFLAKSHGADPPAYEPFHFKELMHPWR